VGESLRTGETFVGAGDDRRGGWTRAAWSAASDMRRSIACSTFFWHLARAAMISLTDLSGSTCFTALICATKCVSVTSSRP
jgi:hypothetical protein